MIFYSSRKKLKKYFQKNIRQPFKRRMLHVNESRLFSSREDRNVYHQLQQNLLTDKKEVTLQIKTSGGNAIYCRCNNDDHFVLHYTFFAQHHLPPKKLQKHPVILDLGSNIGLTVRHLKYCYPKAKIVGVELDRCNFLMAKKNTAYLENCTIINGAVWYKDGFVSYSGDIPQGFHVDDREAEGRRQVSSYTINTLIKENNLATIDFIKMDIEGAESKIFDADVSWLDFTRSLNIEIHNNEPLDKYLKILSGKGFTCVISKKHWSAILAYK